MKTTFYIVCLLLLTSFLHAQDNDTGKTVLYLQNGSRLEGVIVSENDEKIQIRLFGDYEMEVDQGQVEKREVGKPGRKYFSEGHWVTIRGYYSVLNFTTTWGKDDVGYNGNDVLTGIKIQSIHGYKFNKYLSLGLALAIHSFEMPSLAEASPYEYINNNFTSFPIELDVRGFFTDKRIAPYYALNAGYGIAIFKNEESIERKGGVSGQIEVGVRFAGRKTGSFQMGLGYVVQDVEAIYRLNPYNGDLRFVELDTRLQRFALNFGWSF